MKFLITISKEGITSSQSIDSKSIVEFLSDEIGYNFALGLSSAAFYLIRDENKSIIFEDRNKEKTVRIEII